MVVSVVRMVLTEVVICNRHSNRNAWAMVHKGMLFLFFPTDLRLACCRFGIYEQELQVNRNPYTGATTVVRENEFIPMGGAGGYPGYGYGGGYGNRFF